MNFYSPIPSWIDFIRIIFNKKINYNKVLKIWKKNDYIIGFLSQSTWSLFLIYIWKLKLNVNKKIYVWIPEYYCNYSLTPLRLYGAKLIFYPVNESLEPDLSKCKELAQQYKPDIFLLTHFFGNVIQSTLSAEFCKNHKAWLVEDATHCLYPKKEIGEKSRFSIFSPHKFLPIPVGSVLTINKKNNLDLKLDHLENVDIWLEHLEKTFKTIKFKKKNNFFYIIKWFIKRLIQKAGIRKKSIKDFYDDGYLDNPNINTLLHPKIDSVSKKIFFYNMEKIFEETDKRQRALLAWEEIISNNLNVNLKLINKINILDNSSIYQAIFSGKESDIFSSYLDLKKREYPISTWPDLPPEVKKNKEKYLMANNIRMKRFYLPLHNFNNFPDFNYKSDAEDKYFIDWKCIDKDYWKKLFLKINKTNLLQSWNYGEAKAKAEKLKVHRALIKENNETIGIFQVLEKRILGIIKIFRINRGPLFLKNTSYKEKKKIIEKIMKKGNIFKLSILSFAPEMEFNSKNLFYLKSNKKNIFKPKSLISSWINLSEDSEVLENNLKIKWRNDLKNAQKNDYNLEIGNSETLLKWITEKYKLLIKEKNFKGININLLEHLNKNSSLIILRFSDHKKIPVAGIVLATHGNSATYLIGYNSIEGRNLKANHVLLWNAIVHLKKKNYKWFDLGGIDLNNTSITKFKVGLSGKVYKLIGEALIY